MELLPPRFAPGGVTEDRGLRREVHETDIFGVKISLRLLVTEALTLLFDLAIRRRLVVGNPLDGLRREVLEGRSAEFLSCQQKPPLESVKTLRRLPRLRHR